MSGEDWIEPAKWICLLNIKEVPSDMVIRHAVRMVCLLQVLGCPLSWKKFRISSQVVFLGFSVDVASRSIWLPLEKFEKALKALKPLLRKGSKVAKKHIEKLTGLLMWISGVAKPLRPWLASFYNNLKKPCMSAPKRFTQDQLHDLRQILSDSGVVLEDCWNLDVCKGWICSSIGSTRFRSRDDLLQQDLKHDAAYVTFADFSSDHVRVTGDAATTAELWTRELSTLPLLLQSSKISHFEGWAAADAWAVGNQAGIGGWWSLARNPVAS